MKKEIHGSQALERLVEYDFETVLDIGCGTGDDVLALAELVGPKGKVIGLDNSKSMIEEANQRSKQNQYAVQFRVGDIYKLDFADNTFDCCRADRVFMHLPDRQQALSDRRKKR